MDHEDLLMMKDARRRRLDVVLVARFDRFARSVRHLVLALEEFQALGVDFVSMSESIDTSTPTGRLVFQILGAVAELERSLIRERIMMGLERAKRQGKRLGRPRTNVDRDTVAELKAEGLSLRAIARQTGISRTTVMELLRKPSEKPTV